jgi:hypothetical protein
LERYRFGFGYDLNNLSLLAAFEVREEDFNFEGDRCEPLLGLRLAGSVLAAGHEAKPYFGRHLLLPRQQIDQKILCDGPRPVVFLSLFSSFVDGDCDSRSIPPDQQRTPAVTPKS